MAAPSKKSKKSSPLVVTMMLLAVGFAAVAATAMWWTLPNRSDAERAKADLVTEQQQTEQARQQAARYTSVDELGQLVAQVQAADRILPQRAGASAIDDLRLELPRNLNNAAATAGGTFDAGKFEVDTVPLLGMPVGLFAARTTFSVTLTPESYDVFISALQAEGVVFTTTQASATAASGALRQGAPVTFTVTGLVWWTATPPANLGTLGG